MIPGSVQWEVLCPIHGVQQDKCNYKHKQVIVSPPKSRRERKDGGCPHCRAEKVKAAAQLN